MTDLDNLLGSKISLISQHDIRYEGVLYSINAAESSIILRDVRCLGTEDRPTLRTVSPNPQVLPFVSFPGAEIKDLFVHENVVEAAPPAVINTPPPAPAPVPVPVQEVKPKVPEPKIPELKAPIQAPAVPAKPVDPPVAAVKEERRQLEGGRGDHQGRGRGRGRGESTGRGDSGGRGRGAWEGRGRGGRGPAPSRPAEGDDKPTPRPAPQSAAGTGEHLLRLKVKKADGNNADVAIGTEFDFQAAGALNKTEELPAELAARIRVYKKDDFFDALSSDNSDRAEGRRTGLTHAAERVINQDTFGAIALQSNYHRGGYYHRGGRGRGRGGGGRGRGPPPN